MPNTYTSLHYHVVFSTKMRMRALAAPIRVRLFPYVGGIARQYGMVAEEVGGVEDHMHVLIDIPARIAVAEAVKLIKGGSSRWLKSTFPSLGDFAWQDGYGAFSLPQSHLESVRAYIQSQEIHHRAVSFADEYRTLLRAHDVQFDERYLLD